LRRSVGESSTSKPRPMLSKPRRTETIERQEITTTYGPPGYPALQSHGSAAKFFGNVY
jgi:hypothetical protein